MPKCLIIVDNSNIFIEGQKFSAKNKNVLKTNPCDKDICDPSWRISFGQLLKDVSEGQEIIEAVLVGSRPPKNDSVWECAENEGFKVTVHDRNTRNEEKSVDTELVAQGTEIICSSAEPGILKILSGDRDFIPLVSVAHRKNWEVEMWAFKNAYKPTGEMAQSVDRIKPLDDYFNNIGHCEFKWP
ncbi:MAG: NYN domain-containing protein [Fibrobacter sp.]|nr:NYN domain-containing protein [Fibrobacter sp.]